MAEKTKLELSLLYVEDEPQARGEMQNFLERIVEDVYIAKNGKEGFELFKQYRPNIVFTDIYMPKMDGIEMARAIKSISEDVIVAYFTGDTGVNELINAINIGVDYFFLKPTDLSLVEKKLKSYYKKIRLNEAIHKQEALLQAILDFQEHMIVLATDRHIINVNKSFIDFFKCDNIHNINLSEYFIKEEGYVYNTGTKSWLEFILSEMDSSNKVKMLDHKTGNHKVFLVTATTFFLDMDYYIISFIDITDIDYNSKKLEYQANMDPLTNIYNRLKFNNILTQELLRCRRHKHNLSIIMFDVDDFKRINDKYGHLTGDKVLKEIVSIVNRNIRNTDFFTRWGGEEFIIIATETDEMGADILANRIRVDIASYDFKNIGNITCSFGVAKFIDDDSIEDLIGKADNALYQAKSQGKNCVIVANGKNNNKNKKS